MNIVFATHGYLPAFRLGGPIQSVSALAEGLVALGHRVQVFCTDSNLDERLDVEAGRVYNLNGVEVRYYPYRQTAWMPQGAVGFLFAPEMKSDLAAAIAAADLVHTHVPFTYPCLMAGKLARRSGKPLVYHQRGIFGPERLQHGKWKKLAYLHWVERGNLRGAAALVALTEAEIGWYRRLGCRQHIEVIPNGVHVPSDLTRYPPADIATMPKGAPYVLFLSRIHPLKGPQRLVDALTVLGRDHPDVQVVLAGPDEGHMEAGLRQQAGPFANRLHCVGMVEGDRKWSLLRDASVFCLPSDGEGFSMAVLEAMAAATPVVLSPGCHFPEVETANAGLVVDHAPHHIAQALMAALNHRRAWGDNARNMVLAGYSWSAISRRMEHLYLSLVDRNQSSLNRNEH